MTKPARQKPLPVIGWREWVVLPELGISSIKAKVDTGARSSALHAVHVKRFRKGGTRWVRFEVHPTQRSTSGTVTAKARRLGKRSVRASSGHEERRIAIRTDIELFGRRWPIELTLANRDAMGFRLLLGREALRGRFLVNPSRSFLAERPPRRKRTRTGSS